MLDTKQVRDLASRMIRDDLIVFPVRHHSPACALHVLRLFAEIKPCAVLVEGPRSFSPLIASLTHNDTVAPVALYTYAVWKTRDDGGEPAERRLAAYYPFCDYSPELVALREAKRTGVPARFIDLDYADQAQFDETDGDDDNDESASLLDR